MIQEIPYAEYSKTNYSNDLELNDLESNDLELNNLPVSIEIIPHKAIIDHRAQIVYSNEMNNRNRNRNEILFVKSLFTMTFCVVLILVLSSIRI